MDLTLATEYYIQAYKAGKKEYSERISKGESGTLAFLEGILSSKDIISEIYLGISEIPVSKVVGTYSYSRAISFSPGFLPIAKLGSEFEDKWIAVCGAHLNEGLRDPIKVYEYLNWYYVVEGNKRISILKFFDVYSYNAEITRLLPKYNENDKTIRIYYEFIRFSNKTGIKSIWLNSETGFDTLLEYIDGGFKVHNDYPGTKYKAFERDVYLPFKKIYHEAGGKKLSITTGDALLEYIKLYGIPSKDEIYEHYVLFSRVGNLISELKAMETQSQVDIKLHEDIKEKSLLSSITSFLKPKKHYSIAFLYPKTIETSNWSYYHDLGRRHAQGALSDSIKTSYYENIPENNKCYDSIIKIASKGYDMIFSTSPAFINGTLKAALDLKDIAFFNCSQSYSFKHVTTYFGRLYEAKFLSGIIAGSMANSDMIGYIGTFPIPEVISCVNAFSIGVKTVNPRAIINVAWLYQWDSDSMTIEIEKNMVKKGIEIISHHNIVGKSSLSRGYGLYKIYEEDGVIKKDHLASPIWNFGIFYEKIISSHINQQSRMIGFFPEERKSINFWWGLSAEVVDLVYSNRLVPYRTRMLVDYLKQGIKNYSYVIYSGPVFDNNGALRIKENMSASVDELLSMEWFCDNVRTELAENDFIHPDTNLLTGKIEHQA